MALIPENGLVVESADSYVTIAEALARAAAVGNLTFVDLDATELQEPALRVAFDYLNTRWDSLWKGLRVRPTDLGNGVAVAADDIGFTAPSSITSSTTDLSVFVGTVNIRVSSTLNRGDFHVTGTPTANLITVTEATVVTEGAGDSFAVEGYDPLQTGSWPRKSVVLPEGTLWDLEQIPPEIKNAQIEYALIAATQALTLNPNPAIDASGRPLTVQERQVGPLSERKEWGDGSVQPITVRPYPKADLLVARYVNAGGVIR